MVLYCAKVYLASLGVFLALDAVWLGLLARGFYAEHLEFLLSARPIWPAAILFYLLFVAGVMVFVVLPGIQGSSALRVFLLGALFGLIAYGTYDLTNLTIVRGWPWIVTVVDMCWGAALTGAVSWVGFLVGKAIA